MDAKVMAPWDEIEYFASPTMTFFSAAAGAPQLVPFDPMRVYLALIPSFSSGTTLFSNDPSVLAAGGGYVIAVGGMLQLYQYRHGPLVQQAWFGQLAGGVGVNCTIVVATMLKWPLPKQEVLRA